MRNLKKVLSLALALVMLLGMMVVGAGAASFSDASSIKNTEAVDVVSGIGVLTGVGDGSFNPEGTLSRAEAAVVVAKLDLGAAFGNLETTNASTFSDVPAGYWGKPYIDYCFARGLIAGVGNNKYNPNGKVTGVEFALMVSRVLGYEDKAEQVGGADWEVDAAALARKAGLTVDVTLGSLPMTRDDMAQVAFNALKADMVYYPNGSINIDVNGTPVTIGGSPATPKAQGSAARYIDGATVTSDPNLQLCEEKFPQLKVKSSEDAFGRPSSLWTYKRDDIAEVPTAAMAEYTTTTTRSAIKSALKVGDSVKVEYYEDGKLNETIDTVGKLSATSIGDNGVLTQAWYDEATNTVKVTLIHTYVGTVSSVVKATSSAKRYVNISTKSTRPDLDPKFTTENFESKDLVTYTCAYSESAAQYKIQEVSVLEKTATATLTKWTGVETGNSKNSFTAGETYKYSKDAYIDVAGTKGTIAGFTVDESELDIYCDKYGYAIYVTGVEADKDYAVVIGLGSSNQYGSETFGATLLFADGTRKEVTAKYESGANKNGSVELSGVHTITTNERDRDDYDATHPNLITDVIGDLVTYHVNKDGVYELTMAGLASGANPTTATGQWSDAYDDAADQIRFTNGRSLFVLDNDANHNNGVDKSLYATSKTVFFVATDGTGRVVYNVYVGYENMPSILDTAATYGVAYVTNGDYKTQLDAVYISAAALRGMSASQTFVVKQKNHEVVRDSDGTYFVMPGINADGEVVNVLVKATTWGADGNSLDNVGDVQATGVFSMTDVVKDGDIITDATFNTPYSGAGNNGVIGDFKAGETYYKNTGVVGAANGVIGIGSSNQNTAAYWAYTKDTKFYEVSANFKTITPVSATDIITDDNDIVYYVADDNATTSNKVVKTVIVQRVDPPAPDATYALNYAAVSGVTGLAVTNNTTSANIANGGKITAGTVVKVAATVESGKKAVVKVNGSSVGTITGTDNLTFSMPAAEATITFELTDANAYNGTIKFDTSTPGTTTVEWTSNEDPAVAPTYDELYSALLAELIAQGYDKGGLTDKSDGTDVKFDAAKKNGITLGTAKSFVLTVGSGLTQVVGASSQAELDAALADAGFSGKIKLTAATATLATAPGKDIEVASGSALTLSGAVTLTNDITGAGSVAATNDIGAAEKIAVTGGISVAENKTLTTAGTWAVPSDVTGAGNVTTGAAVTNGGKIKVSGKVTLGANIDTLTNATGAVDVTADTTVSGALTMAAGKVLTITDAKTLTVNGAATIPGSVTATGTTSGGTLVLKGTDSVGSIDNKVNLTNTSGALTITGTAAPKALTQTAGAITVAAGAKLTLPAAFTTTAMTDNFIVEGELVLGAALTVAAGKKIDVKATGTIDFASAVLSGADATADFVIASGATVKNFTATSQKFYDSTGTKLDTDDAIAAGTYNWDTNADGGSNAGWKAE